MVSRGTAINYSWRRDDNSLSEGIHFGAFDGVGGSAHLINVALISRSTDSRGKHDQVGSELENTQSSADIFCFCWQDEKSEKTRKKLCLVTLARQSLRFVVPSHAKKKFFTTGWKFTFSRFSLVFLPLRLCSDEAQSSRPKHRIQSSS